MLENMIEKKPFFFNNKPAKFNKNFKPSNLRKSDL